MAASDKVKPTADNAPEGTPTPPAPSDVDEYRQQQVDEWGHWVAVEPIPHGNALAYDVGHPVPHSNVIRHGYHLEDPPKVAPRTSPEGRRVLGINE
ncbi:MAG TPA: hypothetical protein VF054_06645 [Micromonosporaceae bacterium]